MGSWSRTGSLAGSPQTAAHSRPARAQSPGAGSSGTHAETSSTGTRSTESSQFAWACPMRRRRAARGRLGVRAGVERDGVHGGFHVLPQGVLRVRAQGVQWQSCPGAAVGGGAAGDGQRAGTADRESKVQRSDRIVGQQARAVLPAEELIGVARGQRVQTRRGARLPGIVPAVGLLVPCGVCVRHARRLPSGAAHRSGKASGLPPGGPESRKAGARGPCAGTTAGSRRYADRTVWRLGCCGVRQRSACFCGRGELGAERAGGSAARMRWVTRQGCALVAVAAAGRPCRGRGAPGSAVCGACQEHRSRRGGTEGLGREVVVMEPSAPRGEQL
jgi:hypothetical protein